MHQLPPTLTGDSRTDRALLNLARLLQEIARTAPLPASSTPRTSMAAADHQGIAQPPTAVHALPQPIEETVG